MQVCWPVANSVLIKILLTRLILFSNSEPPRLRDVVSHLITMAAAPKGIYSDPFSSLCRMTTFTLFFPGLAHYPASSRHTAASWVGVLIWSV